MLFALESHHIWLSAHSYMIQVHCIVVEYMHGLRRVK